jgi:hypothetical protein
MCILFTFSDLALSYRSTFHSVDFSCRLVVRMARCKGLLAGERSHQV